MILYYVGQVALIHSYAGPELEDFSCSTNRFGEGWRMTPYAWVSSLK